VDPRIGVVMPLAQQRGGAEVALLRFLDGLRPELKTTVSLCFLEPGPMAEWANQRGYSTTVMQTGRLRELKKWSDSVRSLYAWIRQDQIGVVLSWMAKAHLYAGPAAWWANVPALWWQHGVPSRGALEQLVGLVPARRIIATSRAVAEAQRRFSGRRTELVTVYPGIDLERLQQAERSRVGRKALGLPSDALIVGIVARLERCKGIDVLMHAYRELLRDERNLHLVVVGGLHPLQPDYATEVQRLPVELGIQRQVTFCGHQSDVAQWMCEMDIVVSATFGEGFGMAIVEAMALGKAVVATRSGGVPEILSDGIDGLLVAPGDVGQLTGALARLVDSSDLRTQLGSAARQRAAHFSAPRFVAEALAAIRKPL
jgi:glycosyltransferase involved in cell wall biosynthesis